MIKTLHNQYIRLISARQYSAKFVRCQSALYPSLIAVVIAMNTARAQDTTLVDVQIFPGNIISMTHDGKGMIWFNSWDGIYQFDGKTISWYGKSDDRSAIVFHDNQVSILNQLPKVQEHYKRLIQSQFIVNRCWLKFLPVKQQNIFTAPDKYGNLWVTNGRNLYAFEIQRYFSWRLSGHSVRGILPAGDDLIVSSYTGIYRNGTPISPEHISSQGEILSYSPKEIIFSSSDRINIYQLSEQKFTTIDFERPAERTEISSIALHNHTIWAGTGRGLYVCVDNKLVHSGFFKPVEYIYPHQSSLLLATTVGIYQRRGKKNIERLEAFPELAYNAITYIDGLWYATSKQGIWQWDGKSAQARHLFASQPLGHMDTYHILRDRKGYLWISTTSGLFRAKPNSDSYDSFLTNTEFNKRSFAAHGDSLYFGSIHGLIAFDPDNFPPTPVNQKPTVSNMWIGLLLGVILFLCALIIVLFRRYRKAASILEAQQNESVAHPDPFISRLEQYIEDNLTTVSVDSLSEFTGLSTRGLYRVLEASYGLKPGDLIRNMKLKKIRSLLEENPTIDKETLANNVGYSEYHLARILEKEGKLR